MSLADTGSSEETFTQGSHRGLCETWQAEAKLGMNGATLLELERLESASWFSAVGIDDAGEAVVLASWGDAMNSCMAPEWEALTLEAANRLGERIRAKSRMRYNEWNNVLGIVRPTVVDLVRRNCEDVMKKNRLSREFEDSVRWDILHGILEFEYSDLVETDFFGKQVDWYVKGHFPCGWQGRFPHGKPILY